MIQVPQFHIHPIICTEWNTQTSKSSKMPSVKEKIFQLAVRRRSWCLWILSCTNDDASLCWAAVLKRSAPPMTDTRWCLRSKLGRENNTIQGAVAPLSLTEGLPSFPCNTNTNTCRPLITNTHKMVIWVEKNVLLKKKKILGILGSRSDLLVE